MAESSSSMTTTTTTTIVSGNSMAEVDSTPRKGSVARPRSVLKAPNRKRGLDHSELEDVSAKKRFCGVDENMEMTTADIINRIKVLFPNDDAVQKVCVCLCAENIFKMNEKQIPYKFEIGIDVHVSSYVCSVHFDGGNELG